MRNQKGSSLIELLIVVCILGIIGSIVVPQFIQSRDRAALKRHFGLEVNTSFSLDERDILGPRVKARLEEMYNEKTAAAERVASAPSDQVAQRLREYQVLRDNYNRAARTAKKFGLWSPSQ